MTHDQHDCVDVDNFDATILHPSERAPTVQFRISMACKVNLLGIRERFYELLGAQLGVEDAAGQVAYAITLRRRLLQVSRSVRRLRGHEHVHVSAIR